MYPLGALAEKRDWTGERGAKLASKKDLHNTFYDQQRYLGRIVWAFFKLTNRSHDDS